jgi:hypothetical protein
MRSAEKLKIHNRVAAESGSSFLAGINSAMELQRQGLWVLSFPLELAFSRRGAYSGIKTASPAQTISIIYSDLELHHFLPNDTASSSLIRLQ